MKHFGRILLLAAVLLCGCAARQLDAAPSDGAGNSTASFSSAAQTAQPPTDTPSAGGAWARPLPPPSSEAAQQSATESDADIPQAPPHPYLAALAEAAAQRFYTPGMSEYERAKAAFDYMVQNTDVAEPIGESLWRVHGGGDDAIPFVQQRALSPLRFGAGMCEDYAAALTLLLQNVGLQARYVPGLTYSLEGHLVDHAWTMVRIDGVWYHLDCQLEDAVSVRRGAVRYRYFLRGDETLAASHLWGQRLIDSGLLTQAQNAEIAAQFLVPACPQDYATPSTHPLQSVPAPDLAALQAEAQSELDAYEAAHGPLPPLALDVIPPVFGLAGFGPADEG